MQRRNEALEKILSESQKENGELKDRVIVLEGSLRQYRNRNSTIELKASLSKIEEMKKRIEELETTLQNGEIQIKHLKANESRNNERLHYFQSQVRDRDHLMEEAVVQIREVADYIQALAVQVDMLTGELEEVEKPVVHLGVDNEDSLGGTPINVQVQLDGRPQGAFLAVRSQHYQTGTSTPVNCSTGLGSNFPVALVKPAKIQQLRVEYLDTTKTPRKKGNEWDNVGIYNKGHSKPITVGRPETETTRHQRPLKHESGGKPENYIVFKKLVERLINIGVVKFDGSSSTENLLPNHIDDGVNAMYEEGLGSVHINAVHKDN
ncbi:uncharacterized protein [Gossypium hirsutum]|uniref:Chromosome segregation protein n=1 Tax=Gossypium hirsutum TaxID=3635 RepID=A0A2P0JB22_GOSHI|nr:uncharacterized protein LOC121213812 [Gossypium hirsutum]AJG06799.1 chromosome segregation protein [Gossypium hirsutum]